MAKENILRKDSELEGRPNVYGVGSAGHLVINVMKKSGYFEVWRNISGFEGPHIRCGSVDQLITAVQMEVRKVIAGEMAEHEETGNH
jgi:hypothetical protein